MWRKLGVVPSPPLYAYDAAVGGGGGVGVGAAPEAPPRPARVTVLEVVVKVQRYVE